MYLKISANRELFNPKEGLKTLLFAPHWLAPHLRYGGGIVVHVLLILCRAHRGGACLCRCRAGQGQGRGGAVCSVVDGGPQPAIGAGQALAAPCSRGVGGAGVGGRGGWRRNNQPNKRRESGGTRGDGATRGGGAGRGYNGMRRGDTTTSQIRGARAAEQEATARQEEKATAPSDPPPRPSPPGNGAGRWDTEA